MISARFTCDLGEVLTYDGGHSFTRYTTASWNAWAARMVAGECDRERGAKVRAGTPAAQDRQSRPAD